MKDIYAQTSSKLNGGRSLCKYWGWFSPWLLMNQEICHFTILLLVLMYNQTKETYTAKKNTSYICLTCAKGYWLIKEFHRNDIKKSGLLTRKGHQTYLFTCTWWRFTNIQKLETFLNNVTKIVARVSNCIISTCQWPSVRSRWLDVEFYNRQQNFWHNDHCNPPITSILTLFKGPC